MIIRRINMTLMPTFQHWKWFSLTHKSGIIQNTNYSHNGKKYHITISALHLMTFYRLHLIIIYVSRTNVLVLQTKLEKKPHINQFHTDGTRLLLKIRYHAARVHYSDFIMSAMASQITSITIVYSTVYSGADQRKYQSSASLALVMGIHQWPVNSPHKGPVTRKMFPFDDVIMDYKQPPTNCSNLTQHSNHFYVDKSFNYEQNPENPCNQHCAWWWCPSTCRCYGINTRMTFVRFRTCTVYTPLPWKNGRHFADDDFICIFMNEKFCILTRISPK